ncbi:DUF1614 domain-containing protein [Pontibacterium granulatum]|uniref:DUF1614 domain-containing protein n=1 Tax=Pontibacterium granulatum TaxID=2036029 RepID=UPI00249BDD94|nr:DUF1614 domain-containing protein [Pontibacterium granulatum]MDI3324477.1 DUF1614 domain-containing protein [Pontibacterium granulatum]
MSRYLNAIITLVIFAIFLKLGSVDSVQAKLQIDQKELAIGMALATFGSLLGLQLFSFESPNHDDRPPIKLGINLGGAVVPLVFLLHFFNLQPPATMDMIILTLLVTAVVYPMTRVDRKRGMIVYLFGAVVFAAVGALLLDPENYLVLAYSAAVLGTLIGGDLLHLPQIKKLAEQRANTIIIGGGGVLDAIFLSGLLAMMTAETMQQMHFL